MRSSNAVSIVSLFVAAVGLGACAPAGSDDGAEDQSQDVTGGSTKIESPVVFLFDSAAPDATPKCAGAMLADDFAVTSKGCARQGLIVGHAADQDGHGARARVARVHLPPTADADIAVVELDAPLAGTHALITHTPLRSGYSVNAFAAAGGKGLFDPEKNEASSISAAMVAETEAHGLLLPNKGTEICDGDIGAPVCSSKGAKISGTNLYGTCGLSGLVVGRASPAPASKPGEPPPPACSGGAWKVAPLGPHANFLRSFAPKAFQPWLIFRPFSLDFVSYAPDGLWGYKAKGAVKACAIDAVTLAPLATGVASPKLTAKVSFAAMEKNATPFGRFGIAPKSDPTAMLWLPAKTVGAAAGGAFDASFEGVVGATDPGDYVVTFRASANGGESWTTCDSDGIANGFSLDKALALAIIDPSAPPVPPTPTPPTTPSTPTPPTTPSTPTTPTTPSTPTPPSTTTPQDTVPLPSAGEGTYADPPATGGEEAEPDPGTELPDAPSPSASKKKAASSAAGCSMASAASSGGSPLSLLGVALGLAALSRRRRGSP